MRLREFAPTSHRDGGEDSGWDDEERKVGPYAQRWCENPNDHPRIRSILKLQGYTVLARGWTHTEIAIQNDKTGRKMIFFDPDDPDLHE